MPNAAGIFGLSSKYFTSPRLHHARPNKPVSLWPPPRLIGRSSKRYVTTIGAHKKSNIYLGPEITPYELKERTGAELRRWGPLSHTKGLFGQVTSTLTKSERRKLRAKKRRRTGERSKAKRSAAGDEKDPTAEEQDLKAKAQQRDSKDAKAAQARQQPGTEDSKAAEGSQQRGAKPLTPVESQSRELNHSILACESWEQLLELMSYKLGDFNLVNSVTAFYRYAKHASSVSPSSREWIMVQTHPLFLNLFRRLDRSVPDMGGHAVSNTAWAANTLRVGDRQFWEKVEQRFLDRLPKMRDMEVSGTLMALGKSGQLSEASFRRIRAPLMAWLEVAGDGLQRRVVNGLLWVYAKIGLGVGYRDRELVTKLAGLAKEIIKQGGAQPRELANMVWVLAKLEVADVQLFDVLARQVVDATRSPQQPSKAKSVRDLEREGHDLANFAWGFGKAYGSLFSFATADVRKSAYIHEHLALVPARLAVFEHIAARMPHVEGHLWPEGISGILSGFSNIRFYDEPTLDLLAARIRTDCGGYQLQAVSVALWAFSTLHYDAPDTFEALASRALQLLQDKEAYCQAHEQAMVMLLFGCANMDALHLPQCKRVVYLVRDWLASGTGRLSTAQSLSNAAWSLACLDLLDQQTLRKILLQLAQMRDLDMQVLSQLYMADMAAHPAPLTAREGASTDVIQFLEECFNLGQIKLASKKLWTKNMEAGFRNITGLHWSIAKAVKEIGGHFQLEAMSEGFPLDIVMEGQKIAIEVDGPFHFTANTRRPLGYHCLKDRLVRRQGWEVIHVPYFVWQKMRSRQERRDYLADALYKAGWKGPAADASDSGLAIPEVAASEHESHEEGNGQEADSGVAAALHEEVDDGANQEPQDGLEGLRERERRLALLPLDRKGGSKSSLLQRQKTARRKH